MEALPERRRLTLSRGPSPGRPTGGEGGTGWHWAPTANQENSHEQAQPGPPGRHQCFTLPAVPDFPLPEPDLLRRLLLDVPHHRARRPAAGLGRGPGPGLRLLRHLGAGTDPPDHAREAAWAGWRLATKRPAIYLGPVDYALLALSLLLAVGRRGLGYAPGGMLAGWEWFGLGLVLVLVRQLAVRPEDKQGILCVLLASAVALSAQGTYQAVSEIPREARAAASKGSPPGSSPRRPAAASTPVPRSLQLSDRLEHRQVHGPYFHPASLAGVLVLGVPVLTAVVAGCAAGRPWPTVALAAASCWSGRAVDDRRAGRAVRPVRGRRRGGLPALAGADGVLRPAAWRRCLTASCFAALVGRGGGSAGPGRGGLAGGVAAVRAALLVRRRAGAVRPVLPAVHVRDGRAARRGAGQLPTRSSARRGALRRVLAVVALAVVRSPVVRCSAGGRRTSPPARNPARRPARRAGRRGGAPSGGSSTWAA